MHVRAGAYGEAVGPALTHGALAGGGSVLPVPCTRYPALTGVNSVFVRSSEGVFEGLTKADFYNAEWTPSFEYKPARHSKPWDNCEGFARSTRTLERRKMDADGKGMVLLAAGSQFCCEC